MRMALLCRRCFNQLAHTGPHRVNTARLLSCLEFAFPARLRDTDGADGVYVERRSVVYGDGFLRGFYATYVCGRSMVGRFSERAEMPAPLHSWGPGAKKFEQGGAHTCRMVTH